MFLARRGAGLWSRALALSAGDETAAVSLLSRALSQLSDEDGATQDAVAEALVARSLTRLWTAAPQAQDGGTSTRWQPLAGIDPMARAAVVTVAMDEAAGDPAVLAAMLGCRRRRSTAALRRGRAAWPDSSADEVSAQVRELTEMVTPPEDLADRVLPDGPGPAEQQTSPQQISSQPASPQPWERPRAAAAQAVRRLRSTSWRRRASSPDPRIVALVAALVALLMVLGTGLTYLVIRTGVGSPPTEGRAEASLPVMTPRYGDLRQGRPVHLRSWIADRKVDGRRHYAYVDGKGEVLLPETDREGIGVPHVLRNTPNGAFVAVEGVSEAGQVPPIRLYHIGEDRSPRLVLESAMVMPTISADGGKVAYLLPGGLAQPDTAPEGQGGVEIVDTQTGESLDTWSGTEVVSAQWEENRLVILTWSLAKVWDEQGGWQELSGLDPGSDKLAVGSDFAVLQAKKDGAGQCLTKWSTTAGFSARQTCDPAFLSLAGASPGGGTVLVMRAGANAEVDGIEAVDMATGEHRRLRTPEQAYVTATRGRHSAAGWEDETHVLLTLPVGEGTGVLRCEVTSGQCERASRPEGMNLPF